MYIYIYIETVWISKLLPVIFNGFQCNSNLKYPGQVYFIVWRIYIYIDTSFWTVFIFLSAIFLFGDFLFADIKPEPDSIRDIHRAVTVNVSERLFTFGYILLPGNV